MYHLEELQNELTMGSRSIDESDEFIYNTHGQTFLSIPYSSPHLNVHIFPPFNSLCYFTAFHLAAWNMTLAQYKASDTRYRYFNYNLQNASPRLTVRSRFRVCGPLSGTTGVWRACLRVCVCGSNLSGKFGKGLLFSGGVAICQYPHCRESGGRTHLPLPLPSFLTSSLSVGRRILISSLIPFRFPSRSSFDSTHVGTVFRRFHAAQIRGHAFTQTTTSQQHVRTL